MKNGIGKWATNRGNICSCRNGIAALCFAEFRCFHFLKSVACQELVKKAIFCKLALASLKFVQKFTRIMVGEIFLEEKEQQIKRDFRISLANTA